MTVSVHQAKTQLSKLLDLIEQGEDVLIERHGRPVARRPGAELSEGDLIAWCRERMTHFKCPSSVVFVDALPKGGTGKIQKSVLREQHGQPDRSTSA